MTMDKYDAASEIKALDRRGTHVILDRYWPSACCYGADDGLDFGSMIRINSCLPQADLNILLDISVEEATKRRPEARDRYERDKEKLKHIRDRYLHMWEVMGVGTEKHNWLVLNGEKSTAEITQQIMNILSSRGVLPTGTIYDVAIQDLQRTEDLEFCNHMLSKEK